jgi:uncharacterized membrane protein (UPF0136 family)
MSSHSAIASGIIMMSSGAYGFAKTKSKPSLFGGVGLASLFFSAAYIIRRTDYQATGHSIAALAGTIALVLGAKRISAPSPPKFRVGPYSLLLVGILNVPYQYLKAYDWK